MTREEAKQLIVGYMTKKPGSAPDYRPRGGEDRTRWEVTSAVFDEMFATGEIVFGTKLSKTGRKMGCVFLKEFAHLSATPVTRKEI